MNRLTLAGALIALVCLGLIIFLFAIELTAGGHQHPYMGIITFIVLPLILNFGLLLGVIGVVRAIRRARRGEDPETVPRLDFSSPKHIKTLYNLGLLALAFMMLSAFGSYQAYEATESVAFCGLACHNVMEPEHTTYQASPHARVGCVECHIGEGATWYVRSKLSGAYQVYSVLFNKYHRPIQTPIHNLRPARETCERCHWPQHFYSAKLQGKTYFASDEQNTPYKVNLLMKIGGGDPKHGLTEGIHYHMYIDSEISYIAKDRQRLVIPYVESRTKDGKVRIYRSTEEEFSDEEIRKGEKRTVDCIECHNRPAHRFPHPAESVNQAMSLLQIDPTLPGVKGLAVEVLQKPYKDRKEAQQSIEKSMREFYQTSHPKVVQEKGAQVDAAIKQVQKIYSLTFFPEMKASWKAYPDHISHMYSPGCFRCHDNKHKSDDGKVLTNDCNICHTILSQSTAPNAKTMMTSIDGLQFKHPTDIGDSWKEMLCSDCHAPKDEEPAEEEETPAAQ